MINLFLFKINNSISRFICKRRNSKKYNNKRLKINHKYIKKSYKSNKSKQIKASCLHSSQYKKTNYKKNKKKCKKKCKKMMIHL